MHASKYVSDWNLRHYQRCRQTDKQAKHLKHQTWKTVSPWSSGILRNDSSRSRVTDDSTLTNQSERDPCSWLNSWKCLMISAKDCMELDNRWQTLPHRVVMEETCFLIRSESYWSVDFESSSARQAILSSWGFRSSISPAIAYGW